MKEKQNYDTLVKINTILWINKLKKKNPEKKINDITATATRKYWTRLRFTG